MATLLIEAPVRQIEPEPEHVGQPQPWQPIGKTSFRDDNLRLALVAFSPDRFAAWLKTFPEDAIVGHPREWKDCPLKRWLDAEGIFSGRSVRVAKDHVEVNRYPLFPFWRHKVLLPHWMMRFIMRVDRNSRPISAGLAMRKIPPLIEHNT